VKMSRMTAVIVLTGTLAVSACGNDKPHWSKANQEVAMLSCTTKMASVAGPKAAGSFCGCVMDLMQTRGLTYQDMLRFGYPPAGRACEGRLPDNAKTTTDPDSGCVYDTATGEAHTRFDRDGLDC
jgi:hypothetical protein